jgi:hypothetical protein
MPVEAILAFLRCRISEAIRQVQGQAGRIPNCDTYDTPQSEVEDDPCPSYSHIGQSSPASSYMRARKQLQQKRKEKK